MTMRNGNGPGIVTAMKGAPRRSAILALPVLRVVRAFVAPGLPHGEDTLS